MIARQDGILKLIFRIADVRGSSTNTTLSEPKVRAYLFTWDHYTTAEGELRPYRCQELNIGYDSGGEPGMQICLLLPVNLEHVIDERSPLFGHTRSSLVAIKAEIIVTFEGILSTTGGTFVLSQSYLAHEVCWNHVFSTIVSPAGDPAACRHSKVGSRQHVVDFSRFHHVYPCTGHVISELTRRMTTDSTATVHRGMNCRGDAERGGLRRLRSLLQRRRAGGADTSDGSEYSEMADAKGSSDISEAVTPETSSSSWTKAQRATNGGAAPKEKKPQWMTRRYQRSAIPPPIVREKTIIVSDFAVVRRRADGQRVFAFRCADVYRNQILDGRVRAMLYRFHAHRRMDGKSSESLLTGKLKALIEDEAVEGEAAVGAPPTSVEDRGEEFFTCDELDLGYDTGRDRLFLWLPTVVEHVIDKRSPLHGLDEAMLAAAGAEVVVSVEGVSYATGMPMVTHRVYRMGANVAFGATFAPMVSAPPQEHHTKGKVASPGPPRIDFSRFHDLVEAPCGDAAETERGDSAGRSGEAASSPGPPPISLRGTHSSSHVSLFTTGDAMPGEGLWANGGAGWRQPSRGRVPVRRLARPSV